MALVWLMMSSRLLMKSIGIIVILWAMMRTRGITPSLVKALSNLEMSKVKTLTHQWTLLMMRGILQKGLNYGVAVLPSVSAILNSVATYHNAGLNDLNSMLSVECKFRSLVIKSSKLENKHFPVTNAGAMGGRKLDRDEGYVDLNG